MTRIRGLVLPCAAIGLTALVVPTPVLAAPRMKRLSDEHVRTYSAHVKRPGRVRVRPRHDARAVGLVRPVTLSGTSEVVIVLGHSRGPVGSREHGGAWSYIRYAGLGDRRGWMLTRNLSAPQRVSTRLVIRRDHPQVRLYRRGRLVFSAPAGVGAGASPTPTGRYYVRERLVPSAAGGIYGPLAFGLSAFSRFRTDWPGGGQVGLHGTNEPELIPGHISNGCVRLRNAAILHLGRLLPVGTPITIR